jgi:hypothetical protein
MLPHRTMRNLMTIDREFDRDARAGIGAGQFRVASRNVIPAAIERESGINTLLAVQLTPGHRHAAHCGQVVPSASLIVQLGLGLFVRELDLIKCVRV